MPPLEEQGSCTKEGPRGARRADRRQGVASETALEALETTIVVDGGIVGSRVAEQDNDLVRLVKALDGSCPRWGNEIKVVDRPGDSPGITGGEPVWGSNPAVPGALFFCKKCGNGLALDSSGRPLVVDRRPGL